MSGIPLLPKDRISGKCDKILITGKLFPRSVLLGLDFVIRLFTVVVKDLKKIKFVENLELQPNRSISIKIKIFSNQKSPETIEIIRSKTNTKRSWTKVCIQATSCIG